MLTLATGRRAARSPALPAPSSHIVCPGHSQGGGVALSLVEKV